MQTLQHETYESPGRGATRILLIDDEPDILVFVARALRRHGYHVQCALEAVQGLEMAATGAYDLILLDVMMPGVDGVAALKAIMAVRPEQPVLMLSALSDTESKVRCLELGASDYMTKPFAFDEMLARVRTRMRERQPAGHDRFMRRGAITLDLQRHAADAGRGPVMLSRREFTLLRHLMRRAGTACSREELLAEVWDTPFDPGTNVVDVYVRRLRRKLGSHAIETLRNVGYTIPVA
jgi:two-component system, OmpR family, response regulator